MKGYILRWNPKISSWTEDRHENLMEDLEYSDHADMNWSIYDFEDLEEGDFFILQQVGTDSDGIAMIGTFSSLPYGDRSWKRRDGTNLFYADMYVHFMISRRLNRQKTDGGKIQIPDENMEKDMSKPLIMDAGSLEMKFPDIQWHKGHSGVLIPQNLLEPLVLELCLQMFQLEKPSLNIAFHDRETLWQKCCEYINTCCPEMHKKIIEECAAKTVYENYSPGESIDNDLIEITFDKEKIKAGRPKSTAEFTEYLLPKA